MRQRIFAASILIAALAVPLAASGQQGKGPRPRIGDRLAGTHWKVDTVDGRPVADPSAMTVIFAPEGDQVSGTAGCNKYIGPFASRGDKVTMGILRVTRVECSPEQAAMQKALIDMLHAAYQASVVDGVLTFVSRQGARSTLEPLAW
ncbi:MAG: META domain-containing protein [Geminicoccaceae bacterium]